MLQDDKYCPLCATSLETRNVEGKDRPVCPQCGKTIYQDPKVATAVVVERDEKVLMVRRGVEPGLGMWSLPGGYVDRGEMVERAAEREVVEETGLEVKVTGLVGVFSESGHPVILITYDCRTLGGTLKPGPEVMEQGFFSPDHLPPLAFPRDRQILDAWKNLREGRHRLEGSGGPE